MAVVPSIQTQGFTQGEFNKRLEQWFLDPANIENPIVPILDCTVNQDNSYTNQEVVSLNASLDSIILESSLLESKRILNEAKNIKKQMETASCIGIDNGSLFQGLVEYATSFVNYYDENKSTFTLESSVNQNPNYYNN